MNETQKERQTRWATAAARQEAYRSSDEWATIRVDRIAVGLCVVVADQCVTHGVKADLGHDLDINGYTNPDGTARDD